MPSRTAPASAPASTSEHPEAQAEAGVPFLRRRLLAFYDDRRRDLPWRREPDPYRVWVSEVMLQQTRVDAVVPYYERWLDLFPTLSALADSELDAVLRAWEGLGYYARARNLHRTAQMVRERHAGELPADAAELRRLPGIGEYTAGAVASIAFGRAEPAVDGNVRRVLCRLFDLEDPAPAELRRQAAKLVPEDRPGDFNQALMELGATVCTPRSPACDACPVARLCRARARGVQEQRPRPKAAKPVPEDDVGTAVVLSPDGRVLLSRRPEDGLLGGLWEFPGIATQPREAPADAARRAAARFLHARLEPADPLGPVVHTFSHRRTTYHAFRFRAATEDLVTGVVEAASDAAWAAPAALSDFALPVAQRKIADRAFPPRPHA